MNVYFNMKYIQ